MMSRAVLTLLASILVGGSAFEAGATQLKYFERVEVGETAKMTGAVPKKHAAKKNKTASTKKASVSGKKKALVRKGRAEKTVGDTGKKLGREFVFDGSTVAGRYHSAGEAVAKVEQEKKMNDLVGMRRDFKDRLAIERDRLKQQAAE